MTAPATTRRAGPFNGNGVTTSFPFTFKVFATTDVAVTKTTAGVGVLLALGSDYTVTLNPDQDASPGGSITYPVSGAPLAADQTLVAVGALPYDQTADLPSGGNYRALVVENALDRTVMQVQQLAEELGRSLTLPPSAAAIDTLLPTPVAYAVLGWNPSGTAIVNLDPSGNAALAADLADFSSPALGDAKIAVKYNAAGSVARTQHEKNADTVSIFDFGEGLATDGSADWSAAFAAANAASLSIDCGDASHVFNLASVVTLRSGTTLFGEYPEIRQGTANTECFNIEGKSNITFSGLVGRGLGTDHDDTDSSRAVFAYGGTSGSNIRTLFCRFYGFAYTPVRHQGNAGVWFGYCHVEGPGSPTLTPVASGRCYGFLADAGCSNVHVFGSSFTKTAQGVRLEQVSRFGLDDLDIFDIIGQHGCYLGSGLSDGTVTAVRVNGVSLCGIKLQAQNDAPDTRGIVIANNPIANCGDQGILVCNGGEPGGSPQSAKNRGIVVAGNTVRTTGGSAINMQNVVGGVVLDNTTDAAAFNGLLFSACSRVTAALNTIENSGLSGIRDQYACTDMRLIYNTLADNATSATPGDRFGVFVQDMTRWEIAGQSISDAAAKMQYGIYCPGGDQTTLTLRNNEVNQATGHGLRLKNGTDPLKIYTGNTFAGTLGPSFVEPPSPTVASAGTLVLPQQADVVKVSGTTTITSIAVGGHSGRVVMLILTGTAQITDGGNIRLAGNATGAANRVVTLGCDGVDWWESARGAT